MTSKHKKCYYFRKKKFKIINELKNKTKFIEIKEEIWNAKVSKWVVRVYCQVSSTDPKII